MKLVARDPVIKLNWKLYEAERDARNVSKLFAVFIMFTVPANYYIVFP